MFSLGIVGLPNVGKSTLFSAISKRIVPISNRPFTTVKPNVAVVPVPDQRLEALKKISLAKEIVPATIEFIDIAGLVKNAHLGEGLGNEFLSYIRNVDAIIHIVRIFEDENISHIHNRIDPFYDIEIVNQELNFAKISKPTLILFNASEEQLDWQPSKINYPWIVLSAKLELTLSNLKEEEKEEFLKEFGLGKSKIEELIKKAYELLDLITFFTIKGENQLRAWEIKRGTKIIEGAGKIHSDFKEKFIKAEIINWKEVLEVGSWQKAKEKGLIKIAGRDYVVQDGDVIEIKI